MLELLIVLVAQTYEDRVRGLHEAVVEDRKQLAAALEKMKAWGWARAEYAKILRLAPDDEVRSRLGGAGALPMANDKGASAPRWHELVGAAGRTTARRHAELAKWCRDNGHPDRALEHWQWALLHYPIDSESIVALDFTGSGASLSAAVWKNPPWKRALREWPKGALVAEKGDLARAWSVDTKLWRQGALEWEAKGLDEEYVGRVIQQTHALLALMGTALNEPEILPNHKRIVMLPSKSDFQRYVDGFVEASDQKKAVLQKRAGGHGNKSRGEIAHFGSDRTDWMQRIAASWMSGFVLEGYAGREAADWFEVGTATTCEVLFFGNCQVKYFEIPEGTQDGDFRQDSAKWEADLRSIVAKGTDPSMEELVGIQTNAIGPAHAVKATSVVRFLMLRWPGLYRAVAASFRKKDGSPRGHVEEALGFTLEELDEFWRRYVLSQ